MTDLGENPKFQIKPSRRISHSIRKELEKMMALRMLKNTKEELMANVEKYVL